MTPNTNFRPSSPVEEFLRNPNEKTFGPVYESTAPLVFTICRRILGRQEDAQDAFQSTYTRLLALAREGGKDAELDPSRLLSRLAAREADALRQRRSRRARKEIAMDALPPAPQTTPAVDEVLSNLQIRERVEALVSTLPDKLRLPVTLHYFDGVSQPEIADALELPVSTVASRIKKAIRVLTPLMRRAGLGEALGILGVIAGGSHLLAPPSAMAAGMVFAKAVSALGAAAGGAAAGAAAGTGAVAASGAGAAVTSGAGGSPLFSGIGTAILNVKAAAGMAIAVVAVGAALWLGGPFHREEPSANPPVISNPGQTGKGTSLTGSPADEDKGKVESSLAAKPTPVPDQDLKIRLVWEDTKASIASTSVTLASGTGRPGAAPVARAQTDPQGNAAFRLPGGWKRAQLKVSDPWAAAEPVVALPCAETREIAVARGGAIYGTVRMAGAGKPAAGAVVRVMNNTATTIAAEDGSFTLTPVYPAAEWWIYAQKDTYLSYREEADITRAPVTPGEKSGPYHLILSAAEVVRGVVSSLETGEAIQGATVCVMNDATFSLNPVSLAESGRDGTYAAPVPRVGRFEVFASAKDHAGDSKVVQVREGEASTCDFKLAAGGVVDVLAVTKGGTPVEGARVRASRPDGHDIPGLETLTDSEGRARLDGISLFESPSIAAHSAEYNSCESARAVFPPGERRTQVTVTLSRSRDEDKARPESGGAVFEGRVTDTEGKPVQGAQVSWTFSYPMKDNQCTTGAEGRYHLEAKQSVSGPRATLMAWGPNLAPQWKQGLAPGTVERPTVADFVLQPGHYLEVTVVDEQDKPVPQASTNVDMRTGDHMYGVPRRDSSQRTNEEGRIRLEDLPAGKVLLSVQAREKTGTSRQEVEVDREVRITLKDLGVVRGRVVDAETGGPVSQYVVKVLGSGAGDQLREPGVTINAADGRFVLDRLNQDTDYEVTVSSEDYEPLTIAKTPCVSKDNPQETVFRVSKGSPLEGVIVDAASQAPLAGARVVYACVRDQAPRSIQWGRFNEDVFGHYQNVQYATTGAGGGFHFSEWKNEGYLFIQCGDYERMILAPPQRRLWQDGAGDLKIGLKPGAAVMGTYSENGEGKPDVRLSLRVSGGRDESFEEARTNTSGRFRWTGLPAGGYSLSGGGLTKQFSLKEGEQKTLDLELEKGECSLSGRVLQGDTPVPDVSVSLSQVQKRTAGGTGEEQDGGMSRSFSARSDKDGKYRIEGIPAGDYSVFAHLFDQSHSRPFGVDIQKRAKISGADTLELVFLPAYKVTARLVFPEGMAEEERAKYRSARLQPRQMPAFDNEEQLDHSGGCDIIGGKISFTGRFKGTCRLGVDRFEGDRSQSIPISDSLKIDNRNGDQDLGEIRLPAIKGFVVSGKVGTLDGNTLPEAGVSLYSASGKGQSFGGQTDAKGAYRIEDVAPGKYRAQVYKGSQDSGRTYRSAKQEVEIQGDTQLQFVALPVYRVTGLLVADDPTGKEIIQKVSWLSLSLKNPSGEKTEESLGISTWGNMSQVRGGVLNFEGSFLGEYSLEIVYHTDGASGRGMTRSIFLPLSLNNLQGDQDLGAVKIPSLCKVRFELAFESPVQGAAKQTGGLMAQFRQEGGAPRQRTAVPLRSDLASQVADGIAPGKYDVAVFGLGYRAEPQRMTVVAALDQEPVVKVFLRPIGLVVGQLRMSDQDFSLRVVTLRGPLGAADPETRVLKPEESVDEEEVFTSGRDVAGNRLFVFQNLRAGEYEVLIEADGYKTGRITRTVVPGDLRQDTMQPISLEPLQ